MINNLWLPATNHQLHFPPLNALNCFSKLSLSSSSINIMDTKALEFLKIRINIHLPNFMHKLIWLIFFISSFSKNTMSAIEFASLPNFPYQKLKHEDNFLDDYERNKVILRSSRSWCRFRRLGSRKRFRLKVPSLRKFLRRKIRVVSALRVSCAKVLKRLKESQAHLGDLFAGNYVFMQVSPTSLKCLEKSFKGQGVLNGLPNSRYSLPRVA